MEALSGINGVPWKMVVVGAGPLSRELETKWKPLFGDRLRLEPPVSHREIPGLMKVLDIFVLPSYGTPRWIEQFGLTLAQAMMAGVPCVGSSSGAIPDVMGPGGVVFRERNVAELREALRSLLVSPSERARLGREGRDFALRNYTHRAVAAATLKAFGADS
jgi:glycosyltransferase involved in cell wall biosynthesis